MQPRTKIVATIGPASDAPQHLRAVIDAGVDVIRLNLSHGTVDTHLARLVAVRAIAAELGRTVAVLADLPGPKIRTGLFPDGGVFLAEGQSLRIVHGSDGSHGELLTVAEEGALDALRIGDPIVLGDGAILLTVTSVESLGNLTARVITGGRVSGSPGIHVPSSRTSLRAPTAEDLALLVEMQRAGVEYVAVSFVRAAEDLRRVRAVLGTTVGPQPLIVAKIETAAAVDALDEILEECDAVMVARGDLGIECPLEDVPHIQKRVIRAAARAGRPVITATQMLESMIHSPTPTRAEVTDVANAVADGTDAVMLSAETAIGHDPALAVSTMARIAARAERELGYDRWTRRLAREDAEAHLAADAPSSDRITAAMANAACVVAAGSAASAVVCCTRSGRTAREVARYRPDAVLLGMSPSAHTVHQLALSWGVRPMQVAEYRTTDEMVWCVVEAAVRSGEAKAGDVLVVLAGSPDRAGGVSDVLRVVQVR